MPRQEPNPPAAGAGAAVYAEALRFGVVADVAGLEDQQVLAMMGVRAVAVGCDLAADLAVVEGEGAEMLRQEDDGVALALVGAEGAGVHHAVALEAEGAAVVVEFGHELAVPDPHAADAESPMI